jgi:hypothetical protein
MDGWLTMDGWLYSVYTVFYLLPILVIEFMHDSITVQSTPYITVLHISHIIVNQLYIVRFRWQLVIEIYASQTIAYKLYFHIQICAFPHLNVLSLYVCILCRILPHVHEYTYDTGQSRPYYFSDCISNFQRYFPPRTQIRILKLRDMWTGRTLSFWNFLRQHCSR